MNTARRSLSEEGARPASERCPRNRRTDAGSRRQGLRFSEQPGDDSSEVGTARKSQSGGRQSRRPHAAALPGAGYPRPAPTFVRAARASLSSPARLSPTLPSRRNNLIRRHPAALPGAGYPRLAVDFRPGCASEPPLFQPATRGRPPTFVRAARASPRVGLLPRRAPGPAPQGSSPAPGCPGIPLGGRALKLSVALLMVG